MYSDQILGYPDVSARYESECEARVTRRRYGMFLFPLLLAVVIAALLSPGSAYADAWRDVSHNVYYNYSTTEYLGQPGAGVVIEKISGTPKDQGYAYIPEEINGKKVVKIHLTEEGALGSDVTTLNFQSAKALGEIVIENQKGFSLDSGNGYSTLNLGLIRISSCEFESLFLPFGSMLGLKTIEIEQSKTGGFIFNACPNVTTFVFRNCEITSPDSLNTHLPDLKNLQTFDCSSSNLSSLDVSKNTKLETLNCSNNQLTSLNLSSNTELVLLDCSSNNLSSLDLSNNTKLQNLNVSSNALTTLDVSPCPNLQSLKCSNNKLSLLNVSSNSELVFLDCSKNELTALDISQNEKLEGLVCSGNKIEDTSALREWIKNHPTYSNGDEVIKNELFAEGEDPGTEPENPNPDNPGQDDPNKDPSNPGNTGSDQPTTPSNPTDPSTPSKPSEPGDPSGPTTVTPSPSNPDPSLLSSIKTITGKWSHNSKGWWFTCTDGSYARGLNRIGSKIYYFDSKAWMKTGWQKIDNKWYYFVSSGALKTGWQKVKGKWYYLDPSTGRMKTGFFKVKNVTYYANSSGAMKTGWQKISNKWYYFASSGAMKTGWVKTGGKWYYLNSEGKMQTGKQVISGKTYFLNSSGAMRTGWIKDGTIWRYANKSGAMQTSKWIGNYYVDANGTMLTNQWVKTNGKEYYVNKAGKWTGAKR